MFYIDDKNIAIKDLEINFKYEADYYISINIILLFENEIDNIMKYLLEKKESIISITINNTKINFIIKNAYKLDSNKITIKGEYTNE